ncbi:MAG: 4-deoxy-4-formamido-L-arabinose-phosphoundecaprenol deformylase [Pseudomonadota bacterium]
MTDTTSHLLGLRIDVDTFRGTKRGVPRLLDTLARHGVKATFFFSVGPDNMGRHLFRLLKPSFLKKMLRSNAPGLYGWDILIRGTLWPGPVIGYHLRDVLVRAAREGHEIGLHAWDHHAWQVRSDRMDALSVEETLTRGASMLQDITGQFPRASAAPGWKCTDAALMAKERFPFVYNSDCRGRSLFVPTVDGQSLKTPQVPVTLPTFDEIIGRDGVTDANYNEMLLGLIRPGQLNVLTIHAEVEGMICAGLFDAFLTLALARGIKPVPLGDLLPAGSSALDLAGIVQREIPGREGVLAVQAAPSSGPEC